MLGAGDATTKGIQTRDIQGIPFICLPTERAVIDGEEVEVPAYCMGESGVTIRDYARIMPGGLTGTWYMRSLHSLFVAECGKDVQVKGRQAPSKDLEKTPAVDDNKVCEKPVELDWHRAERFCEKIGGRLPTKTQWYRAALGPGRGYRNVPKDATNDGALTCGANAQCDAGKTVDMSRFPDDPFGFKGLTDAANLLEWMFDESWGTGDVWLQRVVNGPDYSPTSVRDFSLEFRCAVTFSDSLPAGQEGKK